MDAAAPYRHATDHTPVAQTAHAGREQVPALPHTELRRHSWPSSPHICSAWRRRPWGGVAVWLLYRLFRREAWLCPYCLAWTARHRAWRRVHEEYDIRPADPTWGFRPNRLTRAVPTDELDDESQTYLLELGFGSERESRKKPVEMPYVDCLFDGKRVEGDVIRHEDGSMELRVSRRCSENPRRVSLFDGNVEPNPRIKPIERE
ncbi:hypothetical protein [Bifidobacterium pseudolongum]|uniref:hypothetical protein n=1 Tax=Bifidobacterium pseudolongum TaxID=1694 RepID=UPI0011780C6E|nr:hypothetical protein [Bifidobacterium pseudolongum]